MTLLVGQNNNTAFTGGVELANNSQTDFGVFTAVASGTATTINMWMTVQSGAETFRLGLWNGTTGAPITQSVELNPTGSGDQWISAAISASIVSGTSYILGIFGGANSATNPIFFYTDGTGTGTFEDATSGYPTQPTAGLNITGQIGNMAIYIDGTTSSPATLSSPTPSGTLGTATTATLGCTTTSAAGTLYGVIDTSGHISGITAAQIIAGENNTSGAAAFSGNVAVSGTTPSLNLTGLTANRTYSYALAQANSGNSNVVTGTFTTAAFVLATPLGGPPRTQWHWR